MFNFQILVTVDVGRVVVASSGRCDFFVILSDWIRTPTFGSFFHLCYPHAPAVVVAAVSDLVVVVVVTATVATSTFVSQTKVSRYFLSFEQRSPSFKMALTYILFPAVFLL